MSENIYMQMDNLMDYLLFEIKSRNIEISEFRIQKLIYKIKKELGEKHELYPQLPFYWYLRGPYSEVVSHSFNNFSKRSNLLTKGQNSFISSFPEVEPIFFNIIADKEYFYNELDKDIYRQYAPVPFMYSYRYEIYDVARLKKVVDFDVAEYIDKFYFCEARLPVNKYFSDFSNSFSNLAVNLDLINDTNNFEKQWDSLRKPIMLLWETFVKGVRVMFKDEFYDSRANLWDLEFNNALKELSNAIDGIESCIDLTNYHKRDYTAYEKRILNSTIGSYLRD